MVRIAIGLNGLNEYLTTVFSTAQMSVVLIPSRRYKEKCQFLEETEICWFVVVVRDTTMQTLSSNFPSKQFLSRMK